MVKGLRILKQRRTDTGCFSEFLIAKTPTDLENRAPQLVMVSSSSKILQQPAAARTIRLTGAVTSTVVTAISSAAVTATVSQAVTMPTARVPSTSSSSSSTSSGFSASSNAPSASVAFSSAFDSARRARRRERNRVAAAKCRKKRQDQIDGLSETARGLEDANSQLQRQVDELAEAKQQLARLLRQHRLECPTEVEMPEFALDDEDEFEEPEAIVAARDDVEAALPEAGCFSPPMVTCGSPPPVWRSLRRPGDLPLPPAEPMETNLASLATPAGGLLTPLLLAIDTPVKLEPQSL